MKPFRLSGNWQMRAFDYDRRASRRRRSFHQPGKVVYMDDGEIAYSGDVAGLLEAVDYSRIKLPAEVIARRAKGKPFHVFKPTVPKLDPNSDPLVSFQDVRFKYKEDTPEVLHGINMDVRAGEVIAILGHNGSGKTTTVKHALGLLKPTTGRVLLEGKDSKRTPSPRLPRPSVMSSKAQLRCFLPLPFVKNWHMGPKI